MIEKISYIKYQKGHKNSKGEEAPWVIISHETGKILASFKTKEEAEKHLKRMQYFKHVEGISSGLEALFYKMGVEQYMNIHKINTSLAEEVIKIEYNIFKDAISQGLISNEMLVKIIPLIGKQLRILVVKYLEGEISLDDLKEEATKLIKEVDQDE